MDSRYHSKWCTMIYSRLLLSRNLLSDDGVIFVSIDYNENYNLRSIMNEVFGESCFIGEIYWESKTKSQNTVTSYNKLQPKVEMILVYSKTPKRRFNLVVKGSKEYPFKDERGDYREQVQEYMNAEGIRGRESMIFPISVGIDTIVPPKGKQWQIGKEQVQKYIDNNELYIRDGKVVIKIRPGDERNEKTEPFWGFFDKSIGTAESAKKELEKLIPHHGFETVKPVELIKRLIYHATENGDIVMDFFSGSGTTAQAVLELNKEQGSNRKFILVQEREIIPEDKQTYKAGYKTICELAKDRINQYISGNELDENNCGFRNFVLDDSNMKDVYYSADALSQANLFDMVSNIKEDRNDLDLLFGCVLDWGLPLSLPYHSETIDGCTVHTYNDGDLVACFDENVPESVVTEIAKRMPLRAVFRDASFANSADKINVFEIFKRYMPESANEITKRVKVI